MHACCSPLLVVGREQGGWGCGGVLEGPTPSQHTQHCPVPVQQLQRDSAIKMGTK